MSDILCKTQFAYILAPLCLMGSAGSAHAQATTRTCFIYMFDATTATDETSLRTALIAFESSFCSGKLFPSGSSPSAISEPTLENAILLTYKQSEKRLTALRQSAGAPLVTSPGNGVTGGNVTSKIPIALKGSDGSTLRAEVPTSALSRELLEKMVKQTPGPTR